MSNYNELLRQSKFMLAGVALAVVGLFIRTDVFATILDIVGVIGVVIGIAFATVGFLMLGRERGWWDGLTQSRTQTSGHTSNSSAASAETAPLIKNLASGAAFLLVIVSLTLPWVSVVREERQTRQYSSPEFTLTTVPGLLMLPPPVYKGPWLPEYDYDSQYDTDIPILERWYFASMAAALSVAGLLLVLYRGENGGYVRGGMAAVGLVTLLVYMALLPGAVSGHIEYITGGYPTFDSLGLAIRWKLGYWLAIAGFVLAVAFQVVPFWRAR